MTTAAIPERYMLLEAVDAWVTETMSGDQQPTRLFPGLWEGHAVRRVLGKARFQDAVLSGVLELLPDWTVAGQCR